MDVELVLRKTPLTDIYKDVLKDVTSTLDLELQARKIKHVSWFCTYSYLVICASISPEPYNLWTWNLAVGKSKDGDL